MLKIIILGIEKKRNVTKKDDFIQAKSSGGVAGVNPVAFNLTLLKDHPDGTVPETIIDDSMDLRKFKEALKLTAAESHVLILVDTDNIFNRTIVFLTEKLPKGSYIEHRILHQNNELAAAWIAHHQLKKRSSNGEGKQKFLIADWHSSAGYEVPAVIFVCRYLNDHKNATFCQRAKAKLVIYKTNIPHEKGPTHFGLYIDNENDTTFQRFKEFEELNKKEPQDLHLFDSRGK